VKKRWWKSKTLWLNTIAAGLTIVEANFGILQEKLGPEVYLVGMGVVCALNFFLRTITNQPVGAADEKPQA
jgi:hypothetical protein